MLKAISPLFVCGLVVAGTLLLPSAVTAQDCASCRPSYDGGTKLAGTLDVCFDETTGEFTGAIESEIESGIQSYIGDWASGAGVNLRFDFRSASGCSGADITIWPDDSLIGTATIGQADPSYGNIGVNPGKFDLGADAWEIAGAHEMLHMMGYGHSDDEDCEGVYSIMGLAQTDGETFPGDALCADAAAMSDYYAGMSDTMDYEDDEVNGDCGGRGYGYDVYEVWVEWWINADGSTSWWSWTIYDGFECDPPDM